MDIAVIGAGTAGASSALLLHRAGHRVTLFERVPDPRPIGAGIMLQPSGQHVLEQLGLLAPILAKAAPCEQLRVMRAGGSELLVLKYHDIEKRYLGYGLHRGVLFDALLGAVKETAIDLQLGVDIEHIVARGESRFLQASSGTTHGPFDLVVVADGARSKLRSAKAVARASQYPWGALWFMAEDTDGVFDRELYQVVRGTANLVGLLPTGTDPSGRKCVSLFVSVRADRAQTFLQRPIDVIRSEILALVPRAAPVLAQIGQSSDFLFSGYMDVVMTRWHGRREVYVGDAAHATSPQLGQGANLALYDAAVLAAVLASDDCVPRALEQFTRRRRAHLEYYQFITRALTPFFQSDYEGLGWLRDLAFPWVQRIHPLRKAMTLGMCGVSEGHPFARLPNV